MELGEEFTKVVLSAVAKVSLERVIARLSGKGSAPIDHDLVLGRIKFYAQQISRVKTLLSPETLISIDSFYCAPRLKIGGTIRRPISSADFREDHVLIEGVAGQGKSVLLRSLCVNSILNQGKIAFFYELRRLDKVKPLIKIVQENLHEFGLPGTSEGLKSLAVKKDVEIYLDGFDELDQKTAEKVDRDINYISLAHPFIKIFVSARPHVGLSKNSSLSAYKIEDLDRADIHRLIDKLCRDPDLAGGLKAKLDFHQGKALELLETPLLVTLLVAQYAQTQQVPEQLAEFYDNIFQVLFERHDSFKTPYVRNRHLAITTHAYKKIFQRFCFGSLFSADLSTDSALELAEWAIHSTSLQVDANNFLKDMSNISSLINEEGGHWSFIHNSVQEFYAAAFILSGTDDELRQNAESLTNIPNTASRDQIFRFAREIDEHRFVKFVELPFYESLSKPLDINSPLDNVDVIEWLKTHTVSIIRDKNLVDGGFFFSLRTDCYAETPIRMFAATAHAGSVENILNSRASVSEKIDGLAEIPVVRDRMLSSAREKVQPYLTRRIQCVEFVESRKQEEILSNTFLQKLLARDRR